MTAYFDTSALIPLLVDEPGSRVCEKAWHAARTVVASDLAYVEVHTALAQAQRMGRVTETQHGEALASFERLWNQLATIAPSEAIIRHAASLGAEHALRGYDAVHCATALAIRSEELFAISGDRALLEAWRRSGIPTVDTGQAHRESDGTPA